MDRPGAEGKVRPTYGIFGIPKKAQSDCIARNVANIQRAASEREEVTTKETRYPDGTVKIEKTVRKVIEPGPENPSFFETVAGAVTLWW